MLVKTKKAIYKIERIVDRHGVHNGYIVERTGLPKGVRNGLKVKVSYQGDLIVFNLQGELVLFRGKNKEPVLKTAPIVFPNSSSWVVP